MIRPKPSRRLRVHGQEKLDPQIFEPGVERRLEALAPPLLVGERGMRQRQAQKQ
jgi:hypothetical protein